MILSMPFPPSVNGYWRAPTKGRLAGRHLISAKGRQYRIDAMAAVAEQSASEPLTGRLKVTVQLFPPDRRKRDIDNYLKSLLDALTHAKVWEDDEQVDHLTIERMGTIPGGSAVVVINDL